jgi:hypothetical protein
MESAQISKLTWRRQSSIMHHGALSPLNYDWFASSVNDRIRCREYIGLAMLQCPRQCWRPEPHDLFVLFALFVVDNAFEPLDLGVFEGPSSRPQICFGSCGIRSCASSTLSTWDGIGSRTSECRQDLGRCTACAKTLDEFRHALCKNCDPAIFSQTCARIQESSYPNGGEIGIKGRTVRLQRIKRARSTRSPSAAIAAVV